MASNGNTYTPGPWRIRSLFIGPLEIVAGDDVVAMVGSEEFAQCAANAELIAAAPELLEALENLLMLTNNTAPEAEAAQAIVARVRG